MSEELHHPAIVAVAPAEPKKHVRQDRYQWEVAAIHKLRVEVKMLTAHAKFLREEAKRADFAYFNELTAIRRGRLRKEARMANAALAFLRGRPYASVEGAERLAAGLDVIDVCWLRDEISYFTGDLNAPSDAEVEEWVGENETIGAPDNGAHSGGRDYDPDGQAAVCGGEDHEERRGIEAYEAEGGQIPYAGSSDC